jgi:hypothetical protein
MGCLVEVKAICILRLETRYKWRRRIVPSCAKLGCPASKASEPLCAIEEWMPKGLGRQGRGSGRPSQGIHRQQLGLNGSSRAAALAKAISQLALLQCASSCQ